MTAKLTRIKISGFRSIKAIDLFPSSDVTVLIGPNGSGKSNILWAIEMVRYLAFESLQRFVGDRGGASFLMHYGPKKTPAMDLRLEFTGEEQSHAYEARLGYGSDESLIFLAEKAHFRGEKSMAWQTSDLGTGHRESRLKVVRDDDTTARTVIYLLQQINFYHFHDTSRQSPLRTRAFGDNGGTYLRSDGSNLPAFLLGLKESDTADAKAAWRRIEGLVQEVAPFISELAPSEDRRGVRLEWYDDRREVFGPAHLSDGTLRVLALIAALGQPMAGMPMVSCIDEPELGLHPSALSILCELILSVATRKQVILATQSPVVLDHFEPENVVVTERQDAATTCRHLDPTALAAWLEDYSLSELYEKNIFGGRP